MLYRINALTAINPVLLRSCDANWKGMMVRIVYGFREGEWIGWAGGREEGHFWVNGAQPCVGGPFVWPTLLLSSSSPLLSRPPLCKVLVMHWIHAQFEVCASCYVVWWYANAFVWSQYNSRDQQQVCTWCWWWWWDDESPFAIPSIVCMFWFVVGRWCMVITSNSRLLLTSQMVKHPPIPFHPPHELDLT